MSIPSLHASGCIGKPVKIYALFDQRDNTIFYVGATTKRLCDRLASHVNDSIHLNMRGPRYDTIRSIHESGIRTRIEELETVAAEDWVEAEQFWIGYLRFIGANLTNKAIGGPGSIGTKQTPATQLRRRLAAVGRDVSHLHRPEIRERSANKLRGRSGKKASLETRKKLSESHKGIKWTESQREKIIAKLRLPRKKTGNPSPRRNVLVIDGMRYHGRPQAKSALGVSDSTISNWLRSGKAFNAGPWL